MVVILPGEDLMSTVFMSTNSLKKIDLLLLQKYEGIKQIL
jgi:hypothetical protein